MKNRFLASTLLGASIIALPACSGGVESEIVEAENYTLDMLTLDGTETLAFDADDRLAPAQQSTIEFWVKADWDDVPDSDPVVLSNAGPEGASYMVAIAPERDGLSVISGEQGEAVPFDFSDGKAHHVALIDLGDPLAVVVDGVVIDEIDMTLQALPSEGFFIGSAYGEDDGFIGTIGGLRIWDVAVSTTNLTKYQRKDVLDPSDPHPDLDYLTALSNFVDQDVILIDR
ncbi:MAG: LamG-like jellyroll fold domain-containing protein [Erythrobacter sp.]